MGAEWPLLTESWHNACFKQLVPVPNFKLTVLGGGGYSACGFDPAISLCPFTNDFVSTLLFGKSMSTVSENESWIVDRGAQVIEKKAQSGLPSLSTWERLVYCLWVADYMMRNAGDFANAVDMYPAFQKDAKRFAEELSLRATCEAFSLSQRKLQREYFERFEAICDEIRSAGASGSSRPAE